MLVENIRDPGIQPGRGLSEALAAAGIDAGELAQQAGLGRAEGRNGPPSRGGKGGPGGGQGANGPDSVAVQPLQSVVEQLQEASAASETDEDFTSLLLQQYGRGWFRHHVFRHHAAHVGFPRLTLRDYIVGSTIWSPAIKAPS